MTLYNRIGKWFATFCFRDTCSHFERPFRIRTWCTSRTCAIIACTGRTFIKRYTISSNQCGCTVIADIVSILVRSKIVIRGSRCSTVQALIITVCTRVFREHKCRTCIGVVRDIGTACGEISACIRIIQVSITRSIIG